MTAKIIKNLNIGLGLFYLYLMELTAIVALCLLTAEADLPLRFVLLGSSVLFLTAGLALLISGVYYPQRR